MHDIDRTNRELLGEVGHEFAHELPQETFEFSQETGEFSGESSWETQETEGSFNEVELMEFASELLEVQSEAELDQFLGKLIKSASKAASGFARSSVGRALGGALKSVAKTALPLAGRALGSVVGGPVGGMIGGKLGSMASNLFELELEGLSHEDREFEMAKQYVKLAGAATQAATRVAPSGDPARAAQSALAQAARIYAPGLLRSASGIAASGRSGRWIRRGRTIVLLGV